MTGCGGVRMCVKQRIALCHGSFERTGENERQTRRMTKTPLYACGCTKQNWGSWSPESKHTSKKREVKTTKDQKRQHFRVENAPSSYYRNLLWHNMVTRNKSARFVECQTPTPYLLSLRDHNSSREKLSESPRTEKWTHERSRDRKWIPLT